MGWNFYNSSGELQINDGGVQASAAVFTGNVDLGSNLLVGNAGSTGIAISSAGEVTMAAQPSVLAHNSASDDNATGGGTAVTIDFDTEIFDQNADFASDAFTAPITGRYLVAFLVIVAGLTDDMNDARTTLTSSNRNYGGRLIDPGNVRDGNNTASFGFSVIIDMDAADTFTIVLDFAGGADVADITGGSDLNTFVSVQLIA